MLHNGAQQQLCAFSLCRGLSSCQVTFLRETGRHRANLARRGPEIESWFGVEDGTDPAAANDWSFLPFMALSDGAHA